ATGIDPRLVTPRNADGDGFDQDGRTLARRIADRIATLPADSPVRLYFAANAARFLSSIPLGIQHECRQAKVLRDLLDTGRYGLVITMPGRMVSARALTLAARAKGIPTLDLQAFFISGHPRYKASLADVYGGITD